MQPDLRPMSTTALMSPPSPKVTGAHSDVRRFGLDSLALRECASATSCPFECHLPKADIARETARTRSLPFLQELQESSEG